MSRPREVAVPVATLWAAPDGPRDVDAHAVASSPDVSAWTTSMDHEIRLGLHGRVLSQLLLGEGVRVLEESAGWSRVVALLQPSTADPAGYPGWVRSAHLAEPVPRTSGTTAIVMAPTAPCLVDGPADGPTDGSGDGSAEGRIDLSFGTALWLEDLDETSARVVLPGGRVGTVALRHLRLAHQEPRPTYRPDDVLDSAAQFLGSRYLWGGTSGWGLDCSGLVHLVLRAHGVVVPRDAEDQAAHVDPVRLDEVHPGDLYFFARPEEQVHHVGFVSRTAGRDNRRWMLHAPQNGALLEDGPLAPARQQTLVSAGRVRTPSAGQA